MGNWGLNSCKWNCFVPLKMLCHNSWVEIFHCCVCACVCQRLLVDTPNFVSVWFLPIWKMFWDHLKPQKVENKTVWLYHLSNPNEMCCDPQYIMLCIFTLRKANANSMILKGDSATMLPPLPVNFFQNLTLWNQFMSSEMTKNLICESWNSETQNAQKSPNHSHLFWV